MSHAIRTRRLSALCLVLAAVTTAPAQASDRPAMSPVPLTLVLQKECGAARSEALQEFASRALAWCPFDGTRLMAGFTDTRALAGRRLYLSLDVDAAGQPPSQPHPQITMTVSAFGAAGEVRAHLGMTFQLVQDRLEASMYIPVDAASVYWSLSGAGQQADAPRLRIRAARAAVSERTFRPGQMCDACSRYLDQALARVRGEFLFAERLPLDELTGALRVAASGAQDVRELDGVLKELARKLGEAALAAGMAPHGGYHTRAEYAANAVQGAATAQHGAAPFDARLLGARIGYLRLRTFQEANTAAGRRYAQALRQAIVGLHRQGARRWIVDLRDHRGGTLFPPIAALRPLLGQDAVGYFVDAQGRRHGAWRWGAAGVPGDPYYSATDPGFDGARQPAALLLGPATASSGEMLAIAFQGRPASRSFGAPTAGFTTAVSGAPDQYANSLGILSKYSADRHDRRVYPTLIPDVAIGAPAADGPGAPDPASADPVLAAATAWLAAQQ